MEVTAGKIAALMLAGAYVSLDIIWRHGVQGPTFVLTAALLFPLSLIWFPDMLGDQIAGRVTRTTPAGFVAFGGWLLLLVPIVIYVIFTAHGVPITEYELPWSF